MLFDLRGRGRKNTVKVVYITLAFLMGGGLVLFGIGGEVSGGLVDAITGAPSGDTGEKRFKERETAALRKIERNPKDEAAHVDLIRSRISLAGVGDRFDPNTGVYSNEGKAKLREAVQSWQQYQALDPEPSDEQAAVASRMVQAFSALGDAAGAANAQEIVATIRDTSGTYAQWAILAYQAGQTRKGDLAGKEALAKTDKDLRQQLKQQLDQAKAQGAISQSQPDAG